MRKQLCVLSLLAFSFAGYAQGQVTNNISSFNSIDDLLNTDFVEPESRDVFNGEGGADTNGVADVSVSETTTGVTSDSGNKVAWTATADTTGSTIDPSLVSGGGVTAKDSGYQVSQTFQIDFNGLVIDACGTANFGWSNGSTVGVVWGFSPLETLDANGNPLSGVPIVPPFLNDASPIDGQAGVGVALADAVRTVNEVGTDLLSIGSRSSNNGGSATLIGLGIPANALRGGVRFAHYIEDLCGVNNGDTDFNTSIKDLDLVDFQQVLAVLEPSSVGVLPLFGVWELVRQCSP